jgi:hypothetical protein
MGPRFAAASTLFGSACIAGCGLLLGDLGVSAAPGAGDAAAAEGGDAGSSDPSDTGASVPPDDAGQCPDDRKLCSGACFAKDDARFGCAASSCDPCSIPNAAAVCVAGACAIAACLSGHGDCNHDVTDGCETDTTSAHDECGACGHACDATLVCDRGSCASSCSGSLTNCSGACVDLTSSASNCGACGKPCPGVTNGTATCAASACGFKCNTGYHACGGACASSTSIATCGTSCTACTPPANATATCDGASCGFLCNPNYQPSGGACVPNASWTPETSGTQEGLYGIWGGDSGHVYAVGGDQTPTVLYSTGGGAWAPQQSVAVPSGWYPRAVWGTGPANVFVGPPIQHSAGTGTWTGGGSGWYFAALWGSGPNDIYAGNNGGSDGVIEYSTDGTNWGQQSATATWIHGGWSSGAGNVYAVGGYAPQGAANGWKSQGTILHKTSGGWTTEVSRPLTEDMEFYAVWGTTSGDHVYAVGNHGAIYHSDGSGAWTPQTSGFPSSSLSGVWGSASNDVYVVGSQGLILHSSGDGIWTPQTSNTTAFLRGIWGSGTGDVYVVGDGGTILHHP